MVKIESYLNVMGNSPFFVTIHRNFLLAQLTPFPSNPLLHVHTKLPITSAHVAFTWQLSTLSSHSSMSACRDGFHEDACMLSVKYSAHTIKICHGDINSIFEGITQTSYLYTQLHCHQIHHYMCIESYQSHQHMYHSHGSCLCPVHTHQYLQETWISSGYKHVNHTTGKTLIQWETFPTCNNTHRLHTCAIYSISIKSIVACAYKITNHISTGGIHMAVVYAQFTLINVCM